MNVAMESLNRLRQAFAGSSPMAMQPLRSTTGYEAQPSPATTVRDTTSAAAGRTALKATQEATAEELRRLLSQPVRQVPTHEATVLQDLQDVTWRVIPGSPAAAPFEQATRNQAPAEARALERLSDSQREAYGRLAQAVQEDPIARQAVQVLLLTDALTTQQTMDRSRTLLEGLGHLATDAPLAEGLPRALLLEQLVRELATPSAISQKSKGTCTVTSLQMLMSERMPAEVTRLVTGLASPEGTVKLQDGSSFTREEGTLQEDGSRRSVPSRLLQPAMMEAARPKDYDNATDRFEDGRSGLMDGQLGALASAMTGLEAIVSTVPGEAAGTYPAKEWDRVVREDLLRGKPVFVGLELDIPDKATGSVSRGGHMFLVTGADAQHVHLVNPWGQEERMEKDDLLGRVSAVIVMEEPVR